MMNNIKDSTKPRVLITTKCLEKHPRLALLLHKKLWNWLADNPFKTNAHWPLWDINGGCVESMFQYDICCSVTTTNCRGCMLMWSKNPTGSCWHLSESHLFTGLRYKWKKTNNLKKRSQLARAIANLPLRNK